MTDILVTPEELDPTNGEENNNNNLQNNSEENTQPENAETNNGSGRKHYRKDNRRIADLKRTKTQKEKRDKRLGDEIDSLKADLARGYLIVQLVENSEKVKHVQLDVSDKEIIRSAIAEKEYKKYELGLDIGEIDMKIRELAVAKKSSYKARLSKKKTSKKEDDLVKRVIKELDEASKNGGKVIVDRIQQEAQAGNKDDAYDSLKSFLSQEVKTVSKKLSKSSELEQKVLERVLDKLNTSES